MARATKGDGSIRSKGKGVWEVRVAFGKDSVTGKYSSVSRTVSPAIRRNILRFMVFSSCFFHAVLLFYRERRKK